MSTLLKITALLILIVTIVALAACATPEVKPPAEPKVLKIGSVMPFSGPGSYWGLLIRPVLEIYADEINKDGGLKVGDDMYRVELYFADGPLNPAADAVAAKNLIYDHICFNIDLYCRV